MNKTRVMSLQRISRAFVTVIVLFSTCWQCTLHAVEPGKQPPDNRHFITIPLRPDKVSMARWPAWEKDLYTKLDKKINIDLQDATLPVIAAQLSKNAKMNVCCRRYPDAGRNMNVIISGKFSAKNITVREFLDKWLIYDIANGALIISTEDLPLTISKKYNIRQLCRSITNDKHKAEDIDIAPDEIIRRILSKDLAGTDNVVALANTGMLTAVGSHMFQHKLEMLLSLLSNDGRNAVWHLREPKWRQKLKNKLQQTCNEKFTDMSPVAIAKTVSSLSGIKFILPKKGKVLPDATKSLLTIISRNMTFEQILRQTGVQYHLRPEGIYFGIIPDTPLISAIPSAKAGNTHDADNAPLIFALHDLHDLLHPPVKIKTPRASKIKEHITKLGKPRSWCREHVALELWNDKLMVIQTAEVHDKIAVYLNNLRATMQKAVADHRKNRDNIKTQKKIHKTR